MLHRYKVKRDCYAGPVKGAERLFYADRPNEEKGEMGEVTLDISEGWIPPHHFEPLDGGPVEPVPGKFYENPGQILEEQLAEAPNTLSELQRSMGSNQARGAVAAGKARADQAKADKAGKAGKKK